MNTTVDFEVRTAAGRVVYTTSDGNLAKKYAMRWKGMFPGMVVRRVVTTVRDEPYYTPRLPKPMARQAA